MKKQFAEELLAYCDGFNASAFFSCLRSKGDVTHEAGKQKQQNSALLTTCLFVCLFVREVIHLKFVLTLHLLSSIDPRRCRWQRQPLHYLRWSTALTQGRGRFCSARSRGIWSKKLRFVCQSVLEFICASGIIMFLNS